MCGRPLRHGSFPCPIPSVGSSAFACPACRCGAFMVAAGLHGDARTGSISLLRARRRLEGPPVFPIPSRRLFALALSSVFPASPATPTSALSQAKVEPRKNSFFISTFVPAAPAAARLPGGRGSSAAFLRRRDGPDHPRHLVRQRRRDQHRRFPVQQRGQPRIVGSAPKRPADDRDRPGNGQPPEVALPHLRNPAELRLPPVEHWRGTRPSQAEKSRPRRKPSIGGAKAWIAMAQTGPIPGMAVKRFASSLSFARLRTSLSSFPIFASRMPICSSNSWPRS